MILWEFFLLQLLDIKVAALTWSGPCAFNFPRIILARRVQTSAHRADVHNCRGVDTIVAADSLKRSNKTNKQTSVVSVVVGTLPKPCLSDQTVLSWGEQPLVKSEASCSMCVYALQQQALWLSLTSHLPWMHRSLLVFVAPHFIPSRAWLRTVQRVPSRRLWHITLHRSAVLTARKAQSVGEEVLSEGWCNEMPYTLCCWRNFGGNSFFLLGMSGRKLSSFWKKGRKGVCFGTLWTVCFHLLIMITVLFLLCVVDCGDNSLCVCLYLSVFFSE